MASQLPPFSYDNNGNLSQKTTDGITTTYLWDYANRLIALGSGGATTTYGYDAFGSRVFQTTATSTTIYPFKWYSVASSTSERHHICDHDGVRVQWRHPCLYHRPAIRERRSDWHGPNQLHPPRPPRLHECRDQRQRHRRAGSLTTIRMEPRGLTIRQEAMIPRESMMGWKEITVQD